MTRALGVTRGAFNYTRAQCKYFVSFKDTNINRVEWDIRESGTHVHRYSECAVNQSTGVVTAWWKVDYAEAVLNASVNYLCIASK